MKTDFLKTKEDITAWLDKHKVKNYTLIEDATYGFVVNVEGSVDLSNKELKFIPVKFNEIKGPFTCYDNQLTSLEFCPETVGYSFTVDNNFLTSLEFCPAKVKGSFYCIDNPKLKDIQNIRNFSQILAIHVETLIKKEKANIEAQFMKVASVDNLVKKSVIKV